MSTARRSKTFSGLRRSTVLVLGVIAGSLLHGCAAGDSPPGKPDAPSRVPAADRGRAPGAGRWTRLGPEAALIASTSPITARQGGTSFATISEAGAGSSPRAGLVGLARPYARSSAADRARWQAVWPCSRSARNASHQATRSRRPDIIDEPPEALPKLRDTLLKLLSPFELSALCRVAIERAAVLRIPRTTESYGVRTHEALWERQTSAYLSALEQVPTMRSPARAYVRSAKWRASNAREDLRIDAYLRGCAAAAQLRTLGSLDGDAAQLLAAELGAGWAAYLIGNNPWQRYFESRLSFLVARGADSARVGESCATSAREYFRANPIELFDPESGGA